MKTATRYLILKRGRSVEEQMRAVLESRLTAVKDSEGNIVITEAAAEVKDWAAHS